MRKALCVGIDNYEHISKLYGCVNDAQAVSEALEYNGDGSKNFEVKLITASNKYIKKGELKDAIEELFDTESEVAVFYYAGHGAYDLLGGYLCTSEIQRSDEGLSLGDIMGLVAQSKAKNNIIILDSCFSGHIATKQEMPYYTQLRNGTTILAACGENEYASEKEGNGVFTSLLIEALNGGAMNLLGEVSPGSIYAYIDRALGAWDQQRPLFKANISQFISLRKNSPPIEIHELRKINKIFNTPLKEYPLDHTYEPDKKGLKSKEKNKENEAIFALLQKMVKLNLVVPVGEEHMYYAAINSKACKLTALGQYYWKLIDKKII